MATNPSSDAQPTGTPGAPTTSTSAPQPTTSTTPPTAPVSASTSDAGGATPTPGPSGVYSVLMFTLKGARAASTVLDQVLEAERAAGLSIVTQAVVEHAPDGQVTIHEPGRGGVGGTAGAVAGGVLGLLGGPLGVITLAIAGGVLGGVAGHFAGRAIPADDLRQIGEALPPDTSAFVLVTEDREAEKAIDAMKQYSANVVTIAVGDELSGVIGEAVAAEVTTRPATS
jgi:uncharacterized membrane protein